MAYYMPGPKANFNQVSYFDVDSDVGDLKLVTMLVTFFECWCPTQLLIDSGCW